LYDPFANNNKGIGMGKTMVYLLLCVALSGCDSDAATTQQSDNPGGLAAEDEVVMIPDSFGCEYFNQFTEALEHKTRKEYSAWAGIVVKKPWCFTASDLAPNQKWTVLQIRGPVMQIGQASVQQRETDKERYGHHYWTATAWGKRVAKQ
jgi:hypothetical protein